MGPDPSNLQFAPVQRLRQPEVAVYRFAEPVVGPESRSFWTGKGVRRRIPGPGEMYAFSRFPWSCSQPLGQSGEVFGLHREDKAAAHPFETSNVDLGYAAECYGPANACSIRQRL